jgi:hypothetical protein
MLAVARRSLMRVSVMEPILGMRHDDGSCSSWKEAGKRQTRVKTRVSMPPAPELDDCSLHLLANVALDAKGDLPSWSNLTLLPSFVCFGVCSPTAQVPLELILSAPAALGTIVFPTGSLAPQGNPSSSGQADGRLK